MRINIMKLEDIVKQIIYLKNSLQSNIKNTILNELDDKDKKEVIEKFDFIDEFMDYVTKFFQKFKDGNKMYIMGILNNYQWANMALISTVRMLANKWNETLELIRIDLFDLFLMGRVILVDFHNEGIADKYADERITQYYPLENKVIHIREKYYPYELYDLLEEKLKEFKEEELKPNELESLAEINGLLEKGEKSKPPKVYFYYYF